MDDAGARRTRARGSTARHPRITRIATAVPGRPHDQLAIAERMAVLHEMDARGARRLRAFYRRTRIAARHSVLPDDWTRASDAAFFRPGEPPSTSARMDVFARAAPDLATRAVERLFAPGRGGVAGRAPRPEDVDHLIVASCTGFLAPGLDVHLVRRLGLRADVGRTLVGFQGCQAGLTALRVARDIAAADPARSVLVVCVELSTLHFQYEATPANVLANALFADGAAAALIEGAEVSRAGDAGFSIDAVSTHLLPDGADDMRWSVGDRGFTLALSERLPSLLGAHVAQIIGDARSRPTVWAVHPGGAAILDAISRSLDLDPAALDASRATLERCGNLSSATVFFVLERLRASLDAGRAARSPDGQPVVALAFGPGVTVEIARLSAHAPNKDGDAWLTGRTSRHVAATRS